MSLSTDSSTLVAQIIVEYNKIDIIGSGSKLVKKLSKFQKPQRLEKMQRSLF